MSSPDPHASPVPAPEHGPGVVQPAVRQLAWVLGLAGLLPFFGHAWLAWLTSPYELAGLLRSQVHYTAAILSFLGALHWGLVLALPVLPAVAAGKRLVWSVLPALYAWVVSMYPPDLSLLLLAGALPVVLVMDLLLYRALPQVRWFLSLRVLLTVGATASVLASLGAMSVRLP